MRWIALLLFYTLFYAFIAFVAWDAAWIAEAGDWFAAERFLLAGIAVGVAFIAVMT